MTYRRAAHVLSYWQDRQLVFANPATNITIAGAPLVAEILHFFDRPRTIAELCRRLTRFDPRSLRDAVHRLVAASLLHEGTRAASDERVASWAAWSPHALFFHVGTKDVRYRTRTLRDLEGPIGSGRARPSRRIVAPAIDLPRERPDGEFVTTLKARRTWRRFSRRPVTLAEAALLLDLTWGVQGWLRAPRRGTLALKTSPSGGACHSNEVYLVALRVTGLKPGVYHYEWDAHRLRFIRPVTRADARRYLPAQPWVGDAAALWLMTAAPARVQARYRFSRAYRVVLLEAGHLCQTFCLTATWMGLAPFCTAALADTVIEKDLGIDGASECVLYAAGVGRRPVGISWGPTPKGWPEVKKEEVRSQKAKVKS